MPARRATALLSPVAFPLTPPAAQPPKSADPPLPRVRGKTSPSTIGAPVADPTIAAAIAGPQPAGGPVNVNDEDETDVYVLRIWQPRHGNQDPRVLRDIATETALELITDTPTIPLKLSRTLCEERAYDLPNLHCAFRGCAFTCSQVDALVQHVSTKHDEALRPLASPISASLSPAKIYSAYLHLLAERCRQMAPVANASIDRRCLRQFRASICQRPIGAALCFVCARRFPFFDECGNPLIIWVAQQNPEHLVFGQTPERLEKLLGWRTYEAKYVAPLSNATQSPLRAELENWKCRYTDGAIEITLLACPEDKICHARKSCCRAVMCPSCRVPLCRHCRNVLYRAGKLPPEALANNMFIGVPPRELYTQECTVLELLCASPCLTALTCFSMEWRHLQDRSLGQDAFMNRRRLCAKGNATTFPLQWEDLMSELESLNDNAPPASACQLPHIGEELRGKVAILIKIGKKEEGANVDAKIIHQAVVRRKVVIGLIQAMKSRNHPAYRQIDMTAVISRSVHLPENGVPPELVAFLQDDGNLARVQRQKAATAVNSAMNEEQLRREFARMLKPNAVVLEKSSATSIDINARHVSSFQAVAEATEPTLPEISIYTETKLLDQFQPLYFTLAFPFVFPYGLGMPDPPTWKKQARPRAADAPYLSLSLWVRAMARRVEAQVSRDWVFGFTSWNLLFRSALNLSRNAEAYSRAYFDEDTRTWIHPTGQHLEAAAKQLLQALHGTYVDVSGCPRAVKGDVSKLRFVRGLKPMARKFLNNMRHTAQGLPGTQEARKRMRFEIQAMRIKYGVPLFITFTPDEAHQLLFIRMSRVRQCDPVRVTSVQQDFPAGDINFPPLAELGSTTSPFESQIVLPMSWADRREILARDPLAAVDGFRVLTHLMLKHLFGVRTCPMCPDCNVFQEDQATPCQDEGGNNAEPCGGIFGRVDAVYISLEAQKSTGSKHGHAQVFVECLHQHTPLEEIFALKKEQLDTLRAVYEKYQAHVCHATYAGQSDSHMKPCIERVEANWPEHEHDTVMTDLAAYQLQQPQLENIHEEARRWRQHYLEEDVVALQLLKQHHYHPFNAATQARVPLSGCQKSDRPGVCKSDFPRTQWLCNNATVLCPCKLKQFGMPTSGRKNRLGSLHGPYGNEWLNPCSPALLAGLRGANCDVQIPYRLPYACATCGENLPEDERRAIALAAQRAQDAQTGNCADYCSKSQPMGWAELKEFQKGHEHLHASLAAQNRSVDEMGKRHVNRFLSDAYLKGQVRGQVECTNLRAHHRDDAVVSAERIATSAFESFAGGSFADLVLRMTSSDPTEPCTPAKSAVRWTRRQASGTRHLASFNMAEVYGHRPVASEVWWLSPYEFTAAWRVAMASIPTTRREWETENPCSWDVRLTQAGEKILQKEVDPNKKITLQPGKHYRIKEQDASDRIYFPETSSQPHVRHRCYLQRRKRPCCPHFEHSPVPLYKIEHKERNARLTLTYFRAWTLDCAAASPNVRYVGHLRQPGETWIAALRMWLTHLPCQETKRHVGNFLSIYRVRPSGVEEGNSDDSDVDEALIVTPATLATALRPTFRQTGARGKPGATTLVDDPALAGYKRAVAEADAIWSPQSSISGASPRRSTTTSTRFNAASEADIQSALKKIRLRTKPTTTISVQEPGPAACQTKMKDTIMQVDDFLQYVQSNSSCNAEQLAFLRTVCARVQSEACTGQDRGGDAEACTEPLRWALHGGPGTGKSYVLNLLRRELFEKRLGWKQGREFLVVAHQAVNAEPLDGDTIFKAFGLNFGGNDANVEAQRILDLANGAVQWRWLLIDEISLVSAEILARLEARCRQLVMDLAAAKYETASSRIKPFGGLNVIFSGDLWQLPPPRGTFLGQIPWHLLTGTPSHKWPLSARGQQLMWASAADGGLQGVTELLQCERTQDKWLQELQAELRVGRLSRDNHAFLHGQPTAVPGSWLASQNAPTCGEVICRQLHANHASPTTLLENECAICAQERKSKRLVATGPTDPRFTNEFVRAQAIFGTNVVKCHVNRVRAEHWARCNNQQLHYAVARDIASSEALHAKPNLTEEKLFWLQRADADCGDRCGVLPLCMGMPVQARDHLHRGDFKILKGCHGYVVGWSAAAAEAYTRAGDIIWNQLPQFIFVGFQTRRAWRLDALGEDNVFPVAVSHVRHGFWIAAETIPNSKSRGVNFL